MCKRQQCAVGSDVESAIKWQVFVYMLIIIKRKQPVNKDHSIVVAATGVHEQVLERPRSLKAAVSLTNKLINPLSPKSHYSGFVINLL